jgi:hypothetical protein
MQSSANPVKNQRAMPAQRQEHPQDKGPKFDAFFQSVLVGLDRRSKAMARHCDQKR